MTLKHLKDRCIETLAMEIQAHAFQTTSDSSCPPITEARAEAEERIDAMPNLELLDLIQRAGEVMICSNCHGGNYRDDETTCSHCGETLAA